LQLGIPIGFNNLPFIVSLFEKYNEALLSIAVSIGRLFLLVKKYYASRKTLADDAVGKGI